MAESYFIRRDITPDKSTAYDRRTKRIWEGPKSDGVMPTDEELRLGLGSTGSKTEFRPRTDIKPDERHTGAGIKAETTNRPDPINVQTLKDTGEFFPQFIEPIDRFDSVMIHLRKRLTKVKKLVGISKKIILGNLRNPRVPEDTGYPGAYILTGTAYPDQVANYDVAPFVLTREQVECFYEVANQSTADPPRDESSTPEWEQGRIDEVKKQLEKIQPIEFGLAFVWLIIKIAWAIIIHGTMGYICGWLKTKKWMFNLHLLLANKLFGPIERLLLQVPPFKWRCAKFGEEKCGEIEPDTGEFRVIIKCCTMESISFDDMTRNPCIREWIDRGRRDIICPGSPYPACPPEGLLGTPCTIDIPHAREALQNMERHVGDGKFIGATDLLQSLEKETFSLSALLDAIEAGVSEKDVMSSLMKDQMGKTGRYVYQYASKIGHVMDEICTKYKLYDIIGIYHHARVRLGMAEDGWNRTISHTLPDFVSELHNGVDYLRSKSVPSSLDVSDRQYNELDVEQSNQYAADDRCGDSFLESGIDAVFTEPDNAVIYGELAYEYKMQDKLHEYEDILMEYYLFGKTGVMAKQIKKYSLAAKLTSWSEISQYYSEDKRGYILGRYCIDSFYGTGGALEAFTKIARDKIKLSEDIYDTLDNRNLLLYKEDIGYWFGKLLIEELDRMGIASTLCSEDVHQGTYIFDESKPVRDVNDLGSIFTGIDKAMEIAANQLTALETKVQGFLNTYTDKFREIACCIIFVIVALGEMVGNIWSSVIKMGKATYDVFIQSLSSSLNITLFGVDPSSPIGTGRPYVTPTSTAPGALEGPEYNNMYTLYPVESPDDKVYLNSKTEIADFFDIPLAGVGVIITNRTYIGMNGIKYILVINPYSTDIIDNIENKVADTVSYFEQLFSTETESPTPNKEILTFIQLIIDVLNIIIQATENKIIEISGELLSFSDMLGKIMDGTTLLVQKLLDKGLEPLDVTLDFIAQSPAWDLMIKYCPWGASIPQLLTSLTANLKSSIASRFEAMLSGKISDISAGIPGFNGGRITVQIYAESLINNDFLMIIRSMVRFLEMGLKLLAQLGNCNDPEVLINGLKEQYSESLLDSVIDTADIISNGDLTPNEIDTLEQALTDPDPWIEDNYNQMIIDGYTPQGTTTKELNPYQLHLNPDERKERMRNAIRMVKEGHGSLKQRGYDYDTIHDIFKDGVVDENTLGSLKSKYEDMRKLIKDGLMGEAITQMPPSLQKAMKEFDKQTEDILYAILRNATTYKKG